MTYRDTFLDVQVAISRLLSQNAEAKIRTKSKLSDDLGSILIDTPNTSAQSWIGRHAEFLTSGFECLDFGCGNAPHRHLIEELGGFWTGCDYAASTDPAALARHGATLGGKIYEYDGRILPFSDASFGAVWSWQALEHVQEPETTFSEIARVLKPGGIFFGSTSFLEPYHAQSTYSYTPYGFKLLCDRHKLTLRQCAPSHDGLVYLLKRIAIILSLDDGPAVHEFLANNSPLEPIRLALKDAGRERDWVHLLAQVCGTFLFSARRIDKHDSKPIKKVVSH